MSVIKFIRVGIQTFSGGKDDMQVSLRGAMKIILEGPVRLAQGWQWHGSGQTSDESTSLGRNSKQ